MKKRQYECEKSKMLNKGNWFYYMNDSIGWVSNFTCDETECNGPRTHNYPEQPFGARCIHHQLDGMVLVNRTVLESEIENYLAGYSRLPRNLITRRECIALECTNSASFKYPSETNPVYCRDHRKEGMIE